VICTGQIQSRNICQMVPSYATIPLDQAVVMTPAIPMPKKSVSSREDHFCVAKTIVPTTDHHQEWQPQQIQDKTILVLDVLKM